MMESLMGIPAIPKKRDAILGPFYRGGGNYVATSSDILMEEYENYKKKLRRFIRQSKTRRCAENQHKDSL